MADRNRMKSIIIVVLFIVLLILPVTYGLIRQYFMK